MSVAGVAMPQLNGTISEQLAQYLEAEKKINNRRANPRNDIGPALAMLQFKFGRFIESRNQRVEDLGSTELCEAKDIKREIFPLGIPKLVLCLDGRIMPKTVAGMQGNAVRVAAADVAGFVPRRNDGHLMLRPESSFAELLKRAFSKTDQLVEVLDSHIGCAARGKAESETKGTKPEDGGVSTDVRRQKAKAKAIREFVQQTYNGAKQIWVFQTSFDPHTGFMYMGLEVDGNLHDPLVQERGYSIFVLETMVLQERIVSTKHLLEEADGQIKAIFEENKFELDYEHDFRYSSVRFWQTVKAIADKVAPLIEAKLIKVYPHLQQQENAAELRQRAVLLLANCFNAFLLNQHGHYSYGEHDESIIVATRSEKGPFPTARPFSVYPESPNLSHDIRLAQGLIRNNRRDGRISREEKAVAAKFFPVTENYALSPVPMVCFERMETVCNDLEAVQKANWSDLIDLNWIGMSDTEFSDYLKRKVPNLTLSTGETINKLRHRAIKLYEPGQPATELLLGGGIVPLWVLAGPNRMNYAILPFLTAGY